MPELPEVETIRRDLDKLIVGKKIVDIITDSPKQVKPSLEELKKAVFGARILKVNRRAKLILIFLDNQKVLAFHLKLTGRLLVRQKKHQPDSWQHVTIEFNDGTELRFCDSRKFGWVRLLGNLKELWELMKEFGPEPLDDLDTEIFAGILKSTSRPIKLILMDQTKISGVGNIYASEALFLARINPKRPASQLTSKQTKVLFRALEEVLKLGLKYRGASDQYYLDAQGQKGHYQEHFLVYGQTGKSCPGQCGGTVKRIVVGGRGTFYCPACQV